MSHEHDSSCDIDDDVPERDESEGYGRGTCRGCGAENVSISNDDGYCMECN